MNLFLNFLVSRTVKKKKKKNANVTETIIFLIRKAIHFQKKKKTNKH